MRTDSFDILNPPLPMDGAVKSQDSEVEASDDENELVHYEQERKIIRQRRSSATIKG